MVLDMIDAPVTNLAYTKSSRGKILVGGSVVFRRYEVKFGNGIYKTQILYSPHCSMAEKRAFAAWVVDAEWCDLDMFLRGLVTLFPSVDKLLSKACAAVCKSAVQAARMTSDFSERSLAEMQALKSVRGQARDFEHFSRASLVSQSRTIHLKNGGEDPRRPAELLASTRSCRSLVMPLFASVFTIWLSVFTLVVRVFGIDMKCGVGKHGPIARY